MGCNIGKTYFTLACIRALQDNGHKVAAMKPEYISPENIQIQTSQVQAL